MTNMCSRPVRSDSTTVTVRAARGQEGGQPGVEGREKKVTCCFLTHLVSDKVCLFVWFVEIHQILSMSTRILIVFKVATVYVALFDEAL